MVRRDRREVIYSAELPPLPRGDDFGVVYLPFGSLRLVRGPRLVPHAPPVDPKALFRSALSPSITLLACFVKLAF